MKGLYRYLSPFSPDQSGAVSVLYELGGIIVIMDAGGCAGNICGFDEPRWTRVKSAVYSAGLRDLDAILGRDEKLVQKIQSAVDTVDAKFIGLIGTPVPAVVGTDLRAMARMCEKRFGLPALFVDTTGIPYYDKGQEKSYLAMIQLLERMEAEGAGAETGPAGKAAAAAAPGAGQAPALGVWGATPLDLPADDSAALLRARAAKAGRTAITFGMESGLEEFGQYAAVKSNLVVSPSGLAPARYIEQKYGIPYETGFLYSGAEGNPLGGKTVDGNVLVVHQQVYANAVRDAIAPQVGGRVDVGTFFTLDPSIAKENDLAFDGEDDFLKAVRSGEYAVLAGDPTFRRALRDWPGTFLPLPHYAVSGELHQVHNEESLYTPVQSSAHRKERG